MRAEHLLISLVGLFFSFFLIFGGLFFFLGPYIPAFCSITQLLILKHLDKVSYFGLGLFFMGTLFLLLLVKLNRRCYLLLKMKTISIEDSLIAHYAQQSLQALFPKQYVECDVVVKRRNKLEILANVPFVADEGRESTLRQIEKNLGSILQKQCQYEKEFILNVCFSTD